jgi:hypothetical protein
MYSPEMMADRVRDLQTSGSRSRGVRRDHDAVKALVRRVVTRTHRGR